MITIDELLQRGRQVTDNYLNAGQDWTLSEQMLKIHEEVMELQQAKTNLEALEEGSDVLYAVLTYFHLQGYDDYAIKTAFESTMKKIEKRSQKVLCTTSTQKGIADA